MDIWQGTTVLTSLGWDQFNGLELFANADNSFSVGTAAKLAGSGASYFSSLSASIDAFGFAPLDALQQFTINIPGLGDSPVAAITDAYAIQKLNNGHWVIAYRSPTSTANVSETIVAEFDANLHLLAIANQGTAMSPGPYDLSAHGNNAYTLTYTNFNPFTLTGTRGFSDDLKISTSPTGAPSTTASTFWDGQNFRQADDIDSLSTDETGTSRVYWLEIDSGKGGTFRPASVKSQLFDAAGAALSPTRTIWDGSSCETTSAGSDRGGLDVAKGSGFEYVAWATHNPDSSDGEDVMVAIITPVPFAVTTVSMRETLNLSVSSDGYRLDQVEVLANGNVAVLWTINNSNSPEDSVHVTILKSDGSLVEDFITTALDDAAHLSITELSDGRIALAGGVQISGAPGTSAPADIAYMIIDPRPDEMFGTRGDDFITGKTGKAEIIHGGDGADRLYTMDGGGTLYGDNGVDLLIGGNGIDTLFGGDHGDNIFGRENSDYIHGGAGADNLRGETGNDVLFGDEGADVLNGGDDYDTASYADSANFVYIVNGNTNLTPNAASGDSFVSIEGYILSGQSDFFDASGLDQQLTIEGGGGEDSLIGALQGGFLYGGDGKDIFAVSGGVNVVRGDEENGTQFFDVLSFFFSTSGINVNMSAATTRNAAFTFTFNGQVSGAFGDVDGISGSVFGDHITGNLFDNSLAGFLGTDIINGGDGNDLLDGGDGQDVLDGGNGKDTADYTEKTGKITVVLNGAANAELRINGLNEDVLRNIENIYGGSNDDTLTGDGFANLLNGAAGHDILSGGVGRDVLNGGADNDTADYRTSIVGQVNANLLLNTFSGGDAAGDTLSSIENLMGSSTLRDILIGNDTANKLQGFGGDDSLRGEAGDDYLEGGAGADALNAGAGIDWAGYRNSTKGQVDINLLLGTATGGDATGDTLFFVENLEGSLTVRDILVGNKVANTIIGNGGVDSIRGEDGNDFIDGGTGGDSLNAGAGIDTLSYEKSSAGVTVDLNVAPQTSAGDANGDSLFFFENVNGSDFADNLKGNLVSNRLVGGLGADTLNGGTGSDYLTGGADADIFRFTDLTFGSDTILDWQDGSDKISLALSIADAFSDFTITGNGTSNAVVRINGVAGSAIIVQNSTAFTLDAGDFVFV